MKKMVDFKADERLNTLNHSCAHVMAQAVKHLYPQAKFWVGPVVKEGFYYDIDLGDDIINDEAIEAIEKEMKKVCKEGKKIYRREISKAEALELFKDDERYTDEKTYAERMKECGNTEAFAKEQEAALSVQAKPTKVN